MPQQDHWGLVASCEADQYSPSWERYTSVPTPRPSWSQKWNYFLCALWLYIQDHVHSRTEGLSRDVVPGIRSWSSGFQHRYSMLLFSRIMNANLNCDSYVKTGFIMDMSAELCQETHHGYLLICRLNLHGMRAVDIIICIAEGVMKDGRFLRNW
jgi:hypothetical protein